MKVRFKRILRCPRCWQSFRSAAFEASATYATLEDKLASMSVGDEQKMQTMMPTKSCCVRKTPNEVEQSQVLAYWLSGGDFVSSDQSDEACLQQFRKIASSETSDWLVRSCKTNLLSIKKRYCRLCALKAPKKRRTTGTQVTLMLKTGSENVLVGSSPIMDYLSTSLEQVLRD